MRIASKLPSDVLVRMRLRILPRSSQKFPFRRTWFERVIGWLLEPIDFPGKWPADELHQRTYNTEGESDVQMRDQERT